MEKLRKLPTYFDHEVGLRMAAGFNPVRFSSALSYLPDDDDVFICTYPKCGTTWMQCILHLLKTEGKPLMVGESINQVVPHIEDQGKDFVQKLSRPRLIKTHLPYDLLPINDDAKYIYVARNVKDCCVSFYHHTVGFPRYYDFEDGCFDDYFEIFIDGKVDCNDYFDHLLSYYNHKDDSNVLFLLYEEMKRNTEQSIKQIGEFLGGIFQKSAEDSEILGRVVHFSDFKTMKATPSIWSTERPKQCAGFIRKGEVGDWRSLMSDDQSKRLDEKLKMKLSGTGAENLWKNFIVIKENKNN